MSRLSLLFCGAALLGPGLAWGQGASGTKDFDQAMQPILAEYLKIHQALAGDTTKGVGVSAAAIQKAVPKLEKAKVSGEHAEHYEGLPGKLADAAASLAGAKTLKEAREQMKKLSKPMAMWVTMSKPKGVNVVFCSMAKGSWVQRSGPIRNPYYGASMLECGEVVQASAQNTGQGEMHHGGMHHGGMQHDKKHH